jgi:hypothetical protein
MGTPLFIGTVEDKKERVITIRLQLFDHENYNQFGTDRVFAWKVLSRWRGLDAPPDWYAAASKHVRSVESGLVTGRVVGLGSNWLTAGVARAPDFRPKGAASG